MAIALSGGIAACGRRDREPRGAKSWGNEGFRDGAFLRPRAIATCENEVYVIDTSGRVQVFTRDGAFLRFWSMPDDKNGTPTALVFAPDGKVLIPDTHYSCIREYSPEGELLTSWGSYGAGEDEFIYPTGIDLDDAGNHYFSEYGGGAERVHVFTPERTFLRQWGGHGDGEGQFNRAMAIAVDRARQCLYVADTTNHRVQCFTLEGAFLRVLGGAGGMKYPHDIALAADGTVFAAEYGSHRITRYAPDGTFIGAYGGPGRGLGQFNGPRGVAVANDGTVYVADTDNHRVQYFTVAAHEGDWPGGSVA